VTQGEDGRKNGMSLLISAARDDVVPLPRTPVRSHIVSLRACMVRVDMIHEFIHPVSMHLVNKRGPCFEKGRVDLTLESAIAPCLKHGESVACK
jgi:hypothetical protein